MFVRVVAVDHYTVAPSAGLDATWNGLTGQAVERVPVLRVFGTTPAGGKQQKVCVHLHGIWPYFFVRLDQRLSTDEQEALGRGVAASLSKAMDLLLKRRQPGQYIHQVSIVRGKPFYGFHSLEERMLKVSVYHPGLVNMMADQLRSGNLMHKQFEVLEAHVPYKLQACIDYNLYGMDLMELSNFTFRESLPISTDCIWKHEDLRIHSVAQLAAKAKMDRIWVHGAVPETLVASHRKKQSSCALEVDCIASDIVNARFMRREPPSSQEAGLPLVQSLLVLWEEERQRLGGATPLADPPVGNCEDDQYQLRDVDFRLRLQLEQYVSREARMIETDTISSGLAQVRKANAIDGFVEAPSESHSSPEDWNAEVDEEGVLAQNERDAAALRDLIDEDAKALILMLDDDEASDRKNREHEILCRKYRLTQLGAPADENDRDGDCEDDDGYDDEDAADDDAVMKTRAVRESLSQLRMELDAREWGLEEESIRASSQLDMEIMQELQRADCNDSDQSGLDDEIIFKKGEEWGGYDEVDTRGGDALESSVRALDRRLSSQYFRLDSILDEESGVQVDQDEVMLQARSVDQAGYLDIFPSANLRRYRLAGRAPRTEDLEEYPDFRISPNKWAYFSRAEDVPSHVVARSICGEMYSAAAETIPLFSDNHGKGLDALIRTASQPVGQFVYTLAQRPPSAAELALHHEGQECTDRTPFSLKRRLLQSQVEGPSGVDAHKFPTPAPPQASSSGSSGSKRTDNLTILLVEVIAEPQGSLLPNPTSDPVIVVAFAMHDQTVAAYQGSLYSPMSWVLYTGELEKRSPLDLRCQTEAELLSRVIDVFNAYDPDIVGGFEIEKGSLGYLIDRANAVGLADYEAKLSRVQTPRPHGTGQKETDLVAPAGGVPSTQDAEEEEEDQPDSVFGQIGRSRRRQANNADNVLAGEEIRMDRAGQAAMTGKQIREIVLVGRHVLNLWRVLRNDVSLQHYSYESFMFHLMHRRVPEFTPQLLRSWWSQRANRWRVLQHGLDRALGSLEMLMTIKTVERTSQLAKVIGIDFFSVLSRGSQYRVESMLLRLTKINNYVLFSPSRLQVNRQHAPMCVPMIMEPQSNFYHDPVLVMDFQSLYPSMMIAYNLCFSTCIGTLMDGKLSQNGIGCNKSYRCTDLDQLGSENISIAPTSSSNGTLFVKKSVRAGVLPAMLVELLETRKLVKRRMKQTGKSDPVLNQLLDFCQLALKLIANVTYGYTSASFTGRMPCIDLADSIVGLGRRTIEQCLKTVESKWPNCKVVYGDTDSVFVLCRGSTRAEAFVIGKEIAEHVTSLNPAPVKLNFEKVYHPCVLMSKKRYVGWKFESPDQEQGVFDAKGIETVRRDSCPLVQKMLSKSLFMLFTNPDLSLIRAYHQRQYRKILSGNSSWYDFIFAKEVKLTQYRNLPSAAIVAQRNQKKDQRRRALHRERISYVVVCGRVNAPLYELVRDPYDLLDPEKGLRLNTTYYITKQVLPALDRVFQLLGINVRVWFEEMPRNVRQRGLIRGPLHAYFGVQNCRVCDARLSSAAEKFCEDCLAHPQQTAIIVTSRMRNIQAKYMDFVQVCAVCTPHGHGTDPPCVSLDCPVMFELKKQRKRLQETEDVWIELG